MVNKHLRSNNSVLRVYGVCLCAHVKGRTLGYWVSYTITFCLFP